MGQISALGEAIKSLRITSCYEGYHDDIDLLRQETIRRYEYANREEFLRQRQTLRQRLDEFEHDPAGASGPVPWRDYMMGYRGDDANIDGEQYTGMTNNEILDRLLVRHHLQRWKNMRAENETIFGDLWNFQMTGHKLIGQHYDIVAKYVFAKEKFVTGIADSLGRFDQLQSIEFLEPPIEGAKRYESMFQKPALRAQGGRGGGGKNETADHLAYIGLMIGFDLLVRALQRANIYPQIFAIPSPSLNFHCFATSASQEVLRHVLVKTQILYLNQISERYITHFDMAEGGGLNLHTKTPSHHEEMGFTAYNFPSVRNLTITTRFNMAYKGPNPLSVLSSWTPGKDKSIIQLDSLTIKLHPLNAANAHLLLKDPNCLNHFGPHLKHLIIKNAYHGNWNHFFRIVARSRLETLSITIEPEVYADVRREPLTLPPHLQGILNMPQIHGMPEVHGLVCVQELFEGAAVQCTVGPEWVYKRVKEVWGEQEAAINRLLEDSEEEGPFDWEGVDDGDDGAEVEMED
jgi:hypothetical protein